MNASGSLRSRNTHAAQRVGRRTNLNGLSLQAQAFADAWYRLCREYACSGLDCRPDRYSDYPQRVRILPCWASEEGSYG